MDAFDRLSAELDALQQSVDRLQEAVQAPREPEPTHLERAIIKAQLDEAIAKIEQFLAQADGASGNNEGQDHGNR